MSPVKDTRMQTKHRSKSLQDLVGKALSGEPTTDDAEGRGIALLGMLFKLYITGEDPFSANLRGFVKALHDKNDPLRKDIPPEQWVALWPALNMLNHAREDFTDARRKAEEASTVAADGAGILGTGSAERSEADGVEDNGAEHDGEQY